MKTNSKPYAIILLLVLAAAVCLPAQAQKNKNEAYHEDSYYLEGAVPEQDGKVVFTKQFSIPGMSGQEVYDKALAWATAHMKENGNPNSRVAFTDQGKGQIAASGLEYIVFQSSGLSLDRVKISYLMSIECADQSCTLQFSKLRYDYPPDEKFTAEESISDEMALNKDHTKLVRGWAKFRRKTVDWVDDMNQGLQIALSGVDLAGNDDSDEKARDSKQVTVIGSDKATAAVTSAATTDTAAEAAAVASTAAATNTEAPATASTAAVATAEAAVTNEAAAASTATAAVTSAAAVKAEEPTVEKATSGFKSIAPNDITADMVSISGGKLVMMVGGNSITANAGGYLSKQGDSTTISTILTPDQDFSAVASAQVYVVNYYPTGSDRPSVIMVCRNVTADKPVSGRANIFTGQITSAQIAE